MGKFTDWISDKTTKQAGIETSGETPLKLSDTVWLDLIGYTIARNLDSTRDHIDYNYDDGTVDFDDNGADTTDNRDAITINYQINHDTDRETVAVVGRPHFHWLQTLDLTPAWVWQWRVLENGKSISAWSAKTEVTSKVYPWVAGGLVQITSLGDIPIEGVSISSIIQVRLWRDGNSANDTYGVTDVQVLSSDTHVPLKYLGSKTEFVQ